MKALLNDPSLPRLEVYRQVLESVGIRTHIRGKLLDGAGFGELSMAPFSPTLCVINDDDYDRAYGLLREHYQDAENTKGTEITCSDCEEVNPGNFDICWSCSADLIP